MAACDPQALLSANPCVADLSPFLKEVVLAAILCNLYNHLDSGEALTCDIQTLLDNSACFSGLSLGELKTVQIQLLCEITALL